MNPKAVKIIVCLSIACILLAAMALYASYHHDQKLSKIRDMERNHRYEIADLETKLHLCQTGRAVERHIDSSMNELRKKLGQ